MLERQIESHLRGKIKNNGGMALKFISPGMSGVPDRLVLMPKGRIYFVELKAKGKKVTPKQAKVHGMLRDLGFEVLVLDSKVAVDEFVDGVKHCDQR